MDISLATDWRKEILSRSRNCKDIIGFILGVIVIFFLIIVLGLNVLFPKDSNSLIIFKIIPIDSRINNSLSAIASFIGILFSMSALPPINHWYTPRKLKYRAAASDIIEELSEDGMISEDQKNELMNIADKYLGALESENSKTDSQKMLMRACTEMAGVPNDGP